MRAAGTLAIAAPEPLRGRAPRAPSSDAMATLVTASPPRAGGVPPVLESLLAAQQAVAAVGLDLRAVLSVAAEQARAVTGAPGAVVGLVEGDEVVSRAVTGCVTESGLRLKLASSLSGLCVRTGRVLRCDDSELDARVDKVASRHLGVRSLLVVPLQRDGEVLGVLKVVSPEPHAFTDADAQVLQLLSGFLGAALGNAAAHAALRESEERYRAVIEHCADGVLIGVGSRFVYANPAMAALLALEDPAELVGRAIEDIVAPDQRDAVVACALARQRGEPVPSRYEVDVIRADGARRTMDMSAARITYGGKAASLAILRDVTEQRQREDELRVLTRRLRLLLHLATGVGQLLTLEGSFDPALRTLVDALPGTDTAAVLLHDAETHELVPRAFIGLGSAYGRVRVRPGEGISGTAFARGEVVRSGVDLETARLRSTMRPENVARVMEATGGRHFTHSVSLPLRTHEGQTVGVLTLGSNRTDYSEDDLRVLEGVAAQLAVALDNARLYQRVRGQASELASALEGLRQAQAQIVQQERLRALGQLASGVAHDLNNTLAPVLGFSELALGAAEALPAQHREWLRLVHEGARDAAGVVARLREFYRTRDAEEPMEPVDVRELLEGVAALTRPRWKDEAQAGGRTISVQIDAPASLPPVAGHPGELREALTNLILNAVDAMPQGGTITLRAYATEDGGRKTVEESTQPSTVHRPPSDHPQDWVTIEVQDTGTGMTNEQRARCLEPFYTTKGDRGTGLGLAMVYGTVGRHGGALDVHSAPGRGTTVRLSLPIASEAAGTAASPIEAPAADERTLRILLADDEPGVRSVIAALLERDGHSVTQAGDGAEALRALDSSGASFDLLITDRAMPGMSGEHLAVAAKQRCPGLPVVLLTGFGDLMNAAGERPDGVDAVFGKPVTMARLRAAIAAVRSE